LSSWKQFRYRSDIDDPRPTQFVFGEGLRAGNPPLLSAVNQVDFFAEAPDKRCDLVQWTSLGILVDKCLRMGLNFVPAFFAKEANEDVGVGYPTEDIVDTEVEFAGVG